MLFAPLVLAIAVPALALLALRPVALRRGASDPDAGWFLYWRGAGLVTCVAWLAWVFVLASAPVLDPLRELASPWSAWLLAPALGLSYTLPPALVSLLAAALAWEVSSRLHGAELTRRETLRQAAWSLGGAVAATACASSAMAAARLGHPRAVAALALAAVAALVVGLRRQRDVAPLEPRAVTTGPFRDRLFALAAGAGLKLRMLYVVRAPRRRIANAFAVRGQIVLVTDLLLTRLSRREVDGIMAHELEHLRRHHPVWLTLPFATATAILIVLGNQFPQPAGWVVGMGGTVLLTLALLRSFEYQADAGAVRMTGDPEGHISALGQLCRLNHVPLDWDLASELFLTHPSTRRRARAIGRRAGLPPGRVDALLREGCGDGTRHEIPAAAFDDARVFTSKIKGGRANRAGLLLLLAVVGAPALLIALGPWRDAPWGGWAYTLGGALLGWGATLLVYDRVVASPYAELRRRIAARLRTEGLDVEREGGIFASLAPGDTPRVFEGWGDWDLGYLFVRGDRLCWVGEECRFALPRHQAAEICVAQGLPGWIPTPRVRITWQDPASGALRSVRLRDSRPSRISATRAASRRLAETLAAWRAGREPHPAPPHPLLDALGAPGFGPVTGESPKHIARPVTMVRQAILLGVFTALVAALVGLPTGFFFDAPGAVQVWQAALLATVLLRLPIWLWREPRSEGAEEKRAAA